MITEHAASSNYVIGWDEAMIIDQEPDKTTRWLKESIWINSRGNKTMNKLRTRGHTGLIESTITSIQNGNPKVWLTRHQAEQGSLPTSRNT